MSREAFEAWVKSRTRDDGALELSLDGSYYLHPRTHHQWFSWQAAERATAQRCKEIADDMDYSPTGDIGKCIAREFGL